MAYQLYGEDGSGSCAVECVLAELDLCYEVRSIDLGAQQQRSVAYASVNPQRKLPTIVTDAGETLTESVAILLTLSERHPEPTLLPAMGSIDRAQALRWLLFVASECYPIVEISDYPERFALQPESAPGLRTRARELWRERWLIVESAITGEPWLFASGFGLTDVYIAVVSRWAQQASWRSSNLPKIERLAAAVAKRPKIAPIWERHFPAQREPAPANR